MDLVIFYKASNESIPVYKKVCLSVILTKNDVDSSTECEFLKNGFLRLCKAFKIMFFERNKEFLDFIINEEESIIERIFNE